MISFILALISKLGILHHFLKSPFRYDLSSQNATPWLTFVARSDEDSQLKLTAGGMSWLINIKATQHYQTISVSVPVKPQKP